MVLCSRTKAEIDAVAGEISGNGGKALAVATDLTVHGQLENLVDAAIKEFGRIDILVNNAARSFLRGLLDLREDGWDKCFNTNVKAVWLLSRLVARKMMEQKAGKSSTLPRSARKKPRWAWRLTAAARRRSSI